MHRGKCERLGFRIILSGILRVVSPLISLTSLWKKFDVQALIFQNNMVQMKNSFTLDCGKAVFRKTI